MLPRLKLWYFWKKTVNCTLSIDETLIEQVSSISYLGTIMNESCNAKREIRSGIEQTLVVFMSTGQFVDQLRIYLLSVLYYGFESWTMGL